MSKEIVYLVQTPDYIPDYVQTLEDMGRDVYLLSYKKPIDHKNNIFFPNSTWAEGRNKLVEIVPKKYLYYVLLDDDVELFVREERYPEEIDKNPWEIFEDFLLKHMPAIGSVYCGKASNSGAATYIDDTKEINVVRFHNSIISAAHKDVIDVCYPICSHYDSFSWWWPGWIYSTTSMFFLSPFVLQCNKLTFNDRLHREYPREINYHDLIEIYQDSLLEDGDKEKLAYAFHFRNSCLHKEYKKPSNGRYKKMAKNFINRIDKSHILWRGHPFINE